MEWLSFVVLEKSLKIVTGLCYLRLSNTTNSIGDFTPAVVSIYRKAPLRPILQWKGTTVTVSKRESYFFFAACELGLQRSCDVGKRRYSWKIDFKAGQKGLRLKIRTQMSKYTYGLIVRPLLMPPLMANYSSIKWHVPEYNEIVLFCIQAEILSKRKN